MVAPLAAFALALAVSLAPPSRGRAVPSPSAAALAVAPSSPARRGRPRLLLDREDDYFRGPDGRCHARVSTRPIVKNETISGKGIVFAVQSDELDDDGVAITAFGFHIDPTSVEKNATLEYELYVLSDDAEGDGHYASTERNPTIPVAVAADAAHRFDHRGDLDGSWELLADGRVGAGDLNKGTTTVDVFEPDQFRIPLGRFGGVPVPGNGGVRSFYIATVQYGLIYADPPEGRAVGAPVDVVRSRDDDPLAPAVLVGEGVATHPMPESAFLYQAKSFVGQVFYERECPSPAPSLSGGPTAAPAEPSQGPSAPPSAVPSWRPSAVPSGTPSSPPSSSPSIYLKKTVGGLLTRINMPCLLDEAFPRGELLRFGDAVQEVTRRAAQFRDPPIRNIVARVKRASCLLKPRRDLGADAPGEGELDGRRRLPTSSSAVDFSVVITGEYKPVELPGGGWDTPVVDLGAITENSINRDPTSFVQDLKQRAGAASRFAEVEADAVQAQSFEVDDDFDVEDGDFGSLGTVTLRPTPAPTSAPTIATDDGMERVLLIGITVIVGAIVLLSAYLVFRHAERRAAQQRREQMARREEEKAGARRDKLRRAQAEKEEKAKGIPGRGAQAPYGGPYGGEYGAPDSLGGYPHPPQYGRPPPPPGQGAHYDRPPLPLRGPDVDLSPGNERSARWSGPPPSHGEPYGGQHGALDAQGGYPYLYQYGWPPPGQSAHYNRPPPPPRELGADRAPPPGKEGSVKWIEF